MNASASNPRPDTVTVARSASDVAGFTVTVGRTIGTVGSIEMGTAASPPLNVVTTNSHCEAAQSTTPTSPAT